MTQHDDMRANIILVDDEEMVRNLLSRALKADGHSVSVASTQKEAFELLDNRDCDLLIVDKNLPDGSGLSIVEGARNMSMDAEAIVITGYSDTDSAIQAVALGVFRYVRKPFDLDALRVDISRALETRKLRLALSNRTRQLEKTNEELRESIEREKEAEDRRIRAERLATIGSLAAGVAHEINNPLALLSMSIPYAVTELENHLKGRTIELDPERAVIALERLSRTLKPTHEAVELLMSLASDLHSLGRTEPVEPWPVKLADAVGSAVRLVRHNFKHKARLIVDVPHDLMVTGHSKRLVQVFINLLTNAARAIDEHDPGKNSVTIRGRKKSDEIVVEVSDTGVGIPAENLDKIFQRFFSVTAPMDEVQGSGIGLSIVREIMEEHSGSVEVRSERGKGTTFSLRFPLTSDHASGVSIPAVARADSGQMIRTRRTILFVDSAEGSIEAYEQSFGQLHDVYLARTPEQAMELLEEHNRELDAVVCELGGEEGHPMWDMFEKVRAQYHELASRFIFLGVPGEESRSAVAEGTQVLHKPVRPATLLAAVYRLQPRRPSSE